jgi:hypothetical protein
MAKRYLRTENDFVIESIAGLKDVTDRHTVAGFENIPDTIIYRRFYQLIEFLQVNNLTQGILYSDISEITIQSDFKNSHLNNKGFYFLQYALPKWEDRFYKDQGEEKEWGFLEKWYKKFTSDNPDLN